LLTAPPRPPVPYSIGRQYNTHPHLLLYRASAQPQKRLRSAGASQSRKRGRAVKGNCCICQGGDASLLSPESRGLLQESVQRHPHTTPSVASDIGEEREVHGHAGGPRHALCPSHTTSWAVQAIQRTQVECYGSTATNYRSARLRDQGAQWGGLLRNGVARVRHREACLERHPPRGG